MAKISAIFCRFYSAASKISIYVAYMVNIDDTRGLELINELLPLTIENKNSIGYGGNVLTFLLFISICEVAQHFCTAIDP